MLFNKTHSDLSAMLIFHGTTLPMAALIPHTTISIFWPSAFIVKMIVTLIAIVIYASISCLIVHTPSARLISATLCSVMCTILLAVIAMTKLSTNVQLYWLGIAAIFIIYTHILWYDVVIDRFLPDNAKLFANTHMCKIVCYIAAVSVFILSLLCVAVFILPIDQSTLLVVVVTIVLYMLLLIIANANAATLLSLIVLLVLIGCAGCLWYTNKTLMIVMLIVAATIALIVFITYMLYHLINCSSITSVHGKVNNGV